MAKKRIYACWALLFVLLFLSSIIHAVGIAQARYQNTATANATIQSSEIGISSNCLVTERNVPRRVLLGQLDLDESISVPFWILSAGADATGKLNWGVENPDHAEYIDISVFAGFEVLEPNAELKLLEDIQMDLLLCLEPTEKAQNTAHDRLQIKIHVTWGDVMWGTFQVVLPEVMEQIVSDPSGEATPDPTTEPSEEPTTTEPSEEATTTEPSEEATTTEPSEEATTTEPPEESTATEPPEESTTTEPPEESTTTEPSEEATTTEPPEEATTTEPSEEPTTTEPSEEATTTEPSEEATTTEPPEESTTTEPSEEPTATEPSEESTTTEPPEESTTTEPSEESTTTEPSEEATTTEPSEETTAEASPEPTTEPSVEHSTEPSTEAMLEDDANAVVEPQIRTLSAFYPAEQIPVLLELPKTVSTIRLGVLTGNADASSFEPFPDYTMFSLDGGASYYMLYGGYIPEFGLNNVTTVPLLVDFSYAQLDCGYENEDGKKVIAFAMETYVEDELSNTYLRSIEINAEPSNQMAFVPKDQQTTDRKLMGPILTFENTLDFTFPLAWRNANLEYSVEHLTMTEEQLLQYVPVTLSKDGLDAAYINTEAVHKLTLQLGEAFTTPGTYRVNMTWTYDNICFMRKQTTFFINSSALMDGVMSSQEVPND